MTKRDQQFRYDVFVSYASEDEGFASKIVGGLVSRGMRVWYAPLVLKIGDPLRKSIEEGMRESFAGIVILSERYIAKNWTEFEFDTLIRQYIERGKKILPIWHGVNHESIYNFSTGLAGIKAMNSSEDLRHIIGNIVYSLSEAAPTRGIIPSYEDLVFRFLNGRAELLDNNVAGPAFTVWEAALHFPTHRYPIWIEGKLIQRDELLFHVAQLLAHNPGVVIASDKDKKELCRLCKNAGYDVDKMK